VPVPRRFDRRPPERDTTRINERIRVPQVRLIGAEGEQLGIVEINEALKRAQDADLDLVEVAPGSKPPVTRLLDYSKYKYEQEQKLKQARKHQQQVNIREIKLRPKIATHDYETKKGHVERFLKHHDKVKITIMFRGREQAHPERGRALLQKLFEDLGGLAVVESAPLQEGRNMSMLLAPSKEALAADEATPAEAEGEAPAADAAATDAPVADAPTPDATEPAPADDAPAADAAPEADDTPAPDAPSDADAAPTPDAASEA
jgi:translation initiation factor IF-3